MDKEMDKELDRLIAEVLLGGIFGLFVLPMFFVAAVTYGEVLAAIEIAACVLMIYASTKGLLAVIATWFVSFSLLAITITTETGLLVIGEWWMSNPAASLAGCGIGLFISARIYDKCKMKKIN